MSSLGHAALGFGSTGPTEAALVGIRGHAHPYLAGLSAAVRRQDCVPQPDICKFQLTAAAKPHVCPHAMQMQAIHVCDHPHVTALRQNCLNSQCGMLNSWRTRYQGCYASVTNAASGLLISALVAARCMLLVVPCVHLLLSRACSA